MDAGPHNIPLTWRIEREKGCKWKSGGSEAEACTPPRVLLRNFGGSVPCCVWFV
jgi:hypothetical protein